MYKQNKQKRGTGEEKKESGKRKAENFKMGHISW